MSQAVIFDRFGMIAYGVGIPEDARPAIIHQLGGRIVEGIRYEPGEVEAEDVWRDGEPAPNAALCVSTADPKHYKIFKYTRDIRPPFVPTGMRPTEIDTGEKWRLFARNLLELDRIASMTDETDTPENWAAVMDALEGRRGA